jgi:Calcineurin-like phosphoesterase
MIVRHTAIRAPGIVTLVHSSDLHIDDDVLPRKYNGLLGLRTVLSKARALRADAVLLAGDTFDNHRVSASVLHETAALLSGSGLPVILLPGNHDPIMPDCLFRRAGLDSMKNIYVFGVDGRHFVELPHLDVEIFGFAHIGMDDAPPINVPRPRQLRWQVVMAHGHYVPPAEWQEQAHRSWKISDTDIAATRADYLALGHWDRAAQVGNGRVIAHYSGSPDLAESVNVITLDRRSGVSVRREKITFGPAARAAMTTTTKRLAGDSCENCWRPSSCCSR